MSAPQTTAPLSARLVSIDCLRGAAVLGVVATHAFHHGRFDEIEAAWFRLLHTAISAATFYPLLFVVSGFCIHLPWARRRAANADVPLAFGAFLHRRLRRTYPPYIVALGLSALAVLVAWALEVQVEIVYRYPEPQLSWIGLDFLLHATLLHGFWSFFDLGAGNPPLWTLARLEYLYLLYFVALAWRRRFGLPTTIGAVFVVAAGLPLVGWVLLRAAPIPSVWQDRALHLVAFETSAIALWFQWCLGMVAAESYAGLIRLPAWCRQAGVGLLWLAAALHADAQAWRAVSPTLWGMAFFTLVNALVAREELGPPWNPAATGWLVRVGAVSYSLYLVHSPLIGVMNQAVARVVGPDSPLLLHPVWHLGMSTVIVGLACAAGFAYFLVVERRFLNSPLQLRRALGRQ